MERLTESNPAWIDDELWESACEPDCEEIDAAYRKLKEYEDLEEQGRLVKLPCKVGDTVYVKLASYCEEKYAEAKVRDFNHFISCGFCVVVTSKHFDKQNIPFTEFGKTVFLTKSEAEAKLKELRGGEDE
jgi:hypothetical protein|uniref:Uncharacterized protein n=1 Tax=virus sp. ctpeS3 TaxID=2826815 RepID=A0A8S5R9X9_9VIRU|nr:MAG TPA: hypothetical protein [virus sp. ctpeS3]